MNTNNIQHYCVFTHPPETLGSQKHYPNALGNNASVIFTDTLPIEEQCLKQAQAFPETTCVFIAPNKHRQNSNPHFDITWYYNNRRIQRCGHGTLAATRYIYDKINPSAPLIFHSTNEQFTATTKQGQYCLQFEQAHLINGKIGAFTHANRAAKTHAENGYHSIDIGNASAVKEFELSDALINAMKQRALIVSSLVDHPQYDIIFRYFAPQYGTFEDQATGSIGPYLWAFWQDHHSKKTLNCYQASTRGGFLTLTQATDKVIVSGYVTEK